MHSAPNRALNLHQRTIVEFGHVGEVPANGLVHVNRHAPNGVPLLMSFINTVYFANSKVTSYRSSLHINLQYLLIPVARCSLAAVAVEEQTTSSPHWNILPCPATLCYDTRYSRSATTEGRATDYRTTRRTSQPRRGAVVVLDSDAAQRSSAHPATLFDGAVTVYSETIKAIAMS